MSGHTELRKHHPSWQVWDWGLYSPKHKVPSSYRSLTWLFLPDVRPTSPPTPANLIGLKIIKQSVWFCSYKDMSLPFQNNSKTYLRAPVLPLPSLLITIPGCLPAFMLFSLCTAHSSGQKILYFSSHSTFWSTGEKSTPLAWELLRQKELTFVPSA